MSHTVHVKTNFTELDKLKSAIERVNKLTDGKLTLTEDAQCRVWAGRGVKCSLVISHPDSSYDLGFQLQKDGTYTIVGESYVADKRDQVNSIPITQAMGPNYQNLNQAYAVEVALDSLRFQTTNVNEFILPNGTLVCEVEVNA